MTRHGSGMRKEKRRMKEGVATLPQLAAVSVGKINPERRQATNRRKPAKRCPRSQNVRSREMLTTGVEARRNKAHLRPWSTSPAPGTRQHIGPLSQPHQTKDPLIPAKLEWKRGLEHRRAVGVRPLLISCAQQHPGILVQSHRSMGLSIPRCSRQQRHLSRSK